MFAIKILLLFFRRVRPYKQNYHEMIPYRSQERLMKNFDRFESFLLRRD